MFLFWQQWPVHGLSKSLRWNQRLLIGIFLLQWAEVVSGILWHIFENKPIQPRWSPWTKEKTKKQRNKQNKQMNKKHLHKLWQDAPGQVYLASWHCLLSSLPVMPSLLPILNAASKPNTKNIFPWINNISIYWKKSLLFLIFCQETWRRAHRGVHRSHTFDGKQDYARPFSCTFCRGSGNRRTKPWMTPCPIQKKYDNQNTWYIFGAKKHSKLLSLVGKNIQNHCQATSFLFCGFFLMSSTKSVMSPNMHRSGKLAATYLCTSVWKYVLGHYVSIALKSSKKLPWMFCNIACTANPPIQVETKPEMETISK